jgi:hypothetical protein
MLTENYHELEEAELFNNLKQTCNYPVALIMFYYIITTTCAIKDDRELISSLSLSNSYFYFPPFPLIAFHFFYLSILSSFFSPFSPLLHVKIVILLAALQFLYTSSPSLLFPIFLHHSLYLSIL